MCAIPRPATSPRTSSEYDEQIGRLRKAVPKMILQLGGSISFAPEPGEEAKFQSYDSRHKLAEIDPKPDQVTVTCGTCLYDLTALHPVDDAFAGTRFTNPAMLHAMANLVADSTPDFYLENIKRMVQHGIQPYFALGHVHSLELVERLIRKGYYMGPVNGFFSIGGGGICGANPFDLMELIRRTPHGSFFTYQTTFRLTHPVAAICIALGQHTRAGIEDNLWNTTKGERMSHDPNDRARCSHGQGAGPADRYTRTGAPDAEDRRYVQIHCGNPRQPRPAAQPPTGQHGLHGA